MPRRTARTGPDKAAGETENIMLDFDGVAKTSSRNLMPNPDLTEEDELGRLRYWELVQRDQADGWWPYITESPKRPFERQGTMPLGLQDGFKVVDGGITRGPTPLDITHQAKIVAPEPGVLELVPLDMLGYAAGGYWVGVACVLNLVRNKRSFRVITGPCDPIYVHLAQGEGFRLPLPREKPDGCIAYVIGMSGRGGARAALYAQQIIGVQQFVPDFAVMRGPWNFGWRLHANSTYIGAIYRNGVRILSESRTATETSEDELPDPEGIEEILAPRYAFVSGDHTLEKGAYAGRVRVKRKYGWSEDGAATEVIRVHKDMPNTSLSFWPERLPLDAERWALTLDFNPDPDVPVETEESGTDSFTNAAVPGVFRNVMQSVQRIVVSATAGKGGFEKNVRAQVHTGDPRKNRAPATQMVNDPGRVTNATGVPDPDFDLEEITQDMKFGGAPITPGRKWVKWTWSDGDEESAPSRAKWVDVPQVNGVATHTIRIRRPPGVNEMANPRFVELGPQEIEHAWERGGNGVTHAPAGGYVVQTDRSGSTSDELVRTDAAVIVADGFARTTKFEMLFAEYTSGAVEAWVEFLNQSGSKIGEALIGIIYSGDHEAQVYCNVGPVGSGVRYEWPVGTYFIRRAFIHVGSDPDEGPRNFVMHLRGFGQQTGFAHGFKRHPLIEPQKEQFRPVVGPEDDEDEYPGFGYTAVLDDWRDSPFANSAAAIEHMTFENNVIPDRWQQEVVSGSGIDVTSVLPITGRYCLRSYDNSTSVNGVATIRRDFDASDRSRIGHQFLFEATTIHSAGDVKVYAIEDLGGANLAYVFLRGVARARSIFGQLWLRVFQADGTSTDTLLRGKVIPSEELLIEFDLDGGGGANGVVRVRIGAQNRRRSLHANLTSLNFASLRPRAVRIGGKMLTNHPGQRWTFRYDDILIDDAGTEAREELPGRIIEYWAPYGSPADQVGPQGCRVPVAPSKDYVFSFYLWYRGCTKPSHPLAINVFDNEGQLLQHVASAAPAMTGRRNWHRVTRGFRTHANAAYIQFGGVYGDGLIRMCALQLDEGTEPTPFTNDHAPNGSISITFDLRVPGMPTFGPTSHHNYVERFRHAGFLGETEPGVTGVEMSYRTCEDIEAPVWSDWFSDIADVPVPATQSGGLQVRAELWTNDLDKTPELREMFADFARPHPLVCRGDGTEYVGGAVAVDFQPVSPNKLIRERISADNTESFSVHGSTRQRAEGWWIEMYDDEGARALMNDQGELLPGRGLVNAGTFWVEDPEIEGGKRFVTRFFNAAFTTESRSIRVRASNRDAPLYLLKAEDIEATVLDEQVL